MKKIILFSLLFVLLFSFNVFANDFIFNPNEEGSVTIVSDKGTIRGKTAENMVVKLNEDEIVTDESGVFVFSNLDKGMYDLVIKNNDGKEVYNEKIEIKNNETVNLGEVNLNSSSVDVENEESQIDFKKIEENNKKEKDFIIDNLSFEHKVSFLNIDYRKELSISDDYRTTFSTKGVLNETSIQLPFKYNNHTISLGMDYGRISSDNAEEMEYRNGSLDNIYMVSYESDYTNLKASYYYDLSNLGRIKGFVGKNYYSNDFDNSSFTNSSNPDHFGKTYFEGDGILYGFSFDTYINKYMNIGDNNLLNNLLIGFEYMQSQDDVKVSSTNDFSSFSTTGYRNSFDFYIGYRKNYDIKLGYKYIENISDEHIDKNYYYPSLEMEMEGFYFSVGMEF